MNQHFRKPMQKRHRKPSARTLALDMLNAVETRGRTLDYLMADTASRECLDYRDRALLNALVYGVLRWRQQLDFIIDHFARFPGKMDPRIRNLLRMGLFQIFHMDRIPHFAAVDTSVNLAASFANAKTVRFVNAILRSTIRKKQIPFPNVKKQPVYGISVTKSMPTWLVRRWLRRFNTDGTLALCDAINRIPPVTLRVNPLRISRDQLTDMLARDAEQIKLTSMSPDGIQLYGLRRPVTQLAGFSDGLFQVQDEAAQLVSWLMGAKPGERILDACAGLGTKTLHLALRMGLRGEIVAVDRDSDRLSHILPEAKRLGLNNSNGAFTIQTITHDWLKSSTQQIPSPFDRILIDAPCSGLGVLRRNPDAKWSVKPSDPDRCGRIQLQLLQHLAHLVKPNGYLVYVVCSTEPEETTQVIHRFLDNNSAFELDDPTADLPESAQSLVDPDVGCLRTFPHLHHMDGFFAARFYRHA